MQLHNKPFSRYLGPRSSETEIEKFSKKPKPFSEKDIKIFKFNYISAY